MKKAKGPHVRKGNCWAYFRSSPSEHDVCPDHDEPRGDCSVCPRCPRCDEQLAPADDAKPEAGRFVGSPHHVALWDAINGLVTASGGSARSTVQRMESVAEVERAVSAIRDAKPEAGRSNDGNR